MKNFFTILVVLAVVCGASGVNANENTTTPVGMAVMKSGDVFKLFYKGAKTGDVKVTILNVKGEAVYKETIANIESFMRPYNFSSLEEGEYIIEIDSEEGRRFEKVSYFKSKNQHLMRLAKIVGEQDKYVLSIPNKGNGVYQVKIFDSNYTLLYNETEKIEGDFAKIYHVTGADDGVSFEVTDKTGTHFLSR